MKWTEMIVWLGFFATVSIIVVCCTGCATNRCDTGGRGVYVQGTLTMCRYG